MSTCLSKNIAGQRRFYTAIVILLVFSICVLLYLQGGEYARCRCVFPDEIMDFHSSVSPHIMDDEQIRCCNCGVDTPLFPAQVNICTSFVWSGSHIHSFLSLENLHHQDCRRQLILNRYKS